MTKPLIFGKQSNGLYHVDIEMHQPTGEEMKLAEVVLSQKSEVEAAKLCHLRFGHIPFERLKINRPSLNVKCVKDNCFCTVCPLARQTRLSFPSSEIKTKWCC